MDVMKIKNDVTSKASEIIRNTKEWVEENPDDVLRGIAGVTLVCLGYKFGKSNGFDKGYAKAKREPVNISKGYFRLKDDYGNLLGYYKSHEFLELAMKHIPENELKNIVMK